MLEFDSLCAQTDDIERQSNISAYWRGI